MIEIGYLGKILEQSLEIWLCAIIARWIIMLLPKKIWQTFRVLGLVVRFPIKQLFYWIYGIKTKGLDWENGTVEIDQEEGVEEKNNVDYLITSNIIAPLSIMLYIGNILLFWGSTLYYQGTKVIGATIFVFGVAVTIFSPPGIEDFYYFKNIDFGSLFFYLLKIFSVSLFAIMGYIFLNISYSLFVTLIVGALLVPIYHKKQVTKKRELRNLNKNGLVINYYE